MAKSIDQLWSELQQIQFDESNSLPCEFHIWNKGTYRYQILDWFEANSENGVLSLQGKTYTTLWEEFGNTPINNDDEIEEDFHLWGKGTERFIIWHWFDDQLEHGVISLIEKGVA